MTPAEKGAPPLRLPSPATLLAVHARLLARDGGAPGVRDEGALDAALARPLNLLAYGGVEGVDVPRLAAAVAFSLCRVRHPFVDGNKRVAFAALVVTLGLNGLELDAAEGEAAETVLRVASGAMAEAEFAAWVAARAVRPAD